MQFRRRFTTSLAQVYYKLGAGLVQVFVIFGPVCVGNSWGLDLDKIGAVEFFVNFPQSSAKDLLVGNEQEKMSVRFSGGEVEP